jgi:hypothetical protein
MGRVIGFLVVTAVGVLLGFLLVFIFRQRFRRNYPAEDRKQQLIAGLVKMKQEGRGYAERLAWLQGQGLHKDVADVLLGEAERAG